MPRVFVDHDRVLDLWAAGLSSRIIAERMNLSCGEAARKIVQRARLKGDPRAIPHDERLGRPRKVPLESYLEHEAARRKTSERKLRRRLIDVIIQDRLVAAVLDR